MAVGIVVVSHSRALAEAAVELAMQMVHEAPSPVAIAAGMPDGGLGTDATAVAAAVAEVDRGDGVVIFVDMGSALMSAEMGVEFAGVENVRILAAPFVEGLTAGLVRAVGGASLADVAEEAESALTPKLMALGRASSPDEQAAGGPASASPELSGDGPDGADGVASGEAVLVNETGLHARPAALFVAEARRFDADVRISNADIGPVKAASSIGLATLNARKGDVLRLTATGPQAREAVDALVTLISAGFGEK
ncbi:dihydroxyacetone kinase phosphoryl donor subunit DhaM [Tessaracoccus sp. Z1128]